MDKVVVGICTYQRLEGLSALLAALQRLQLGQLAAEQITILVVDNSAAGMSKATCEAAMSSTRFAIQYVSETRRGLAYVRNAALAEAQRLGATHLAFIDDDEVPEPIWLEQLYESIKREGAAAACGPVYPLFEAAPGPWVPIQSYALTGLEDTVGHTGNTILDVKKLASLDLQFDIRFNETGGEDTYFFRALSSATGKPIAFADAAVIWERVPPSRMKARWLLRRWFRTGLVEARLRSAGAGTARARTANIAKGVARLAYGSTKIVAAPIVAIKRGRQHFVACCFTFCRGAGYVASAYGHRYAEYAPPPKRS